MPVVTGSMTEGVLVDSLGRPTVVGNIFSGAGVGVSRHFIGWDQTLLDSSSSLVSSTPWTMSKAFEMNTTGDIARGTAHCAGRFTRFF